MMNNNDNKNSGITWSAELQLSALKKETEEVLAWHTQKDHRENHVEWEESYTKTAEAVWWRRCTQDCEIK